MKRIVFPLALMAMVACESPQQSDSNEQTQDTLNMDNTNEDQSKATAAEQEAAKYVYVVMKTSMGDITLELDSTNAPQTVNNFLSYVDDGFFDGTIFHRVIDDFMVQGGGFTADGNQKPTKDPIFLESKTGLKNDAGTIAMARTNAPNSATAQFFINLKDNDFLNYAPSNPGYAVFGKVASGMDVVNSIRQVKTGIFQQYRDWPVEPVTILSIRRE